MPSSEEYNVTKLIAIAEYEYRIFSNDKITQYEPIVGQPKDNSDR